MFGIPKYYKVMPTPRGNYNVLTWEWYRPFWRDCGYPSYFPTKEAAAEWIKADSIYYDGAE